MGIERRLSKVSGNDTVTVVASRLRVTQMLMPPWLRSSMNMPTLSPTARVEFPEVEDRHHHRLVGTGGAELFGVDQIENAVERHCRQMLVGVEGLLR